MCYIICDVYTGFPLNFVRSKCWYPMTAPICALAKERLKWLIPRYWWVKAGTVAENSNLSLDIHIAGTRACICVGNNPIGKKADRSTRLSEMGWIWHAPEKHNFGTLLQNTSSVLWILYYPTYHWWHVQVNGKLRTQISSWQLHPLVFLAFFTVIQSHDILSKGDLTYILLKRSPYILRSGKCVALVITVGRVTLTLTFDQGHLYLHDLIKYCLLSITLVIVTLTVFEIATYKGAFDPVTLTLRQGRLQLYVTVARLSHLISTD